MPCIRPRDGLRSPHRRIAASPPAAGTERASLYWRAVENGSVAVLQRLFYTLLLYLLTPFVLPPLMRLFTRLSPQWATT